MSDLDRQALVAFVESRAQVATFAEAAAAGFTRSTVRWALRSEALVRVRAGAFTTSDLWERSAPEARHVLELRAAQRLNPDAVACSTSAAVVLGLPVPVLGPPRMAAATANGRRAGANFGRPRPGEVITCRGIRVTSAVQTVLDCARLLEPAWGLAVADAAVYQGLSTIEKIRTAAASMPAGPGSRRAAWVAGHVKSKVESPLESLGRAAIILGGFAEPEPQVWVRTRGGRFRVDMLDEANRVVTEADGKLKYQDPQAVWKEKGRQDDLRDVPLEVVRFTMADHHRRQPWLMAYRRALSRAARLG